MFGCSTVCPKCQHEFTCCPPVPCCKVRRALLGLSGGGLVPASLSPTSPCPSPQISPSVPLAFVMPTLTPLQTLHQVFPDFHPESDVQRLADTVRALRLSGWFYEGITYQESQELLQKTPIGTFLVRESSDPRFFYSLSVQTERGPTSVRIHYVSGYFRLDAQPHLKSTMPLFSSVIELIQYYVAQSRASMNSAQVWVDPKGKLYSPIVLDRPLRKDKKPPSLKHLTRLAIHKSVQATSKTRVGLFSPAFTQLELPSSLTTYLAEYPYSL